MAVRQVHQTSQALHNAAAKNGSSGAAGPNSERFNDLMARQIGQASAWEGGRRQPTALPGVRQNEGGNGAMLPLHYFAPTFRIAPSATVEEIDITADVESDKEAKTDEMVDGLQNGKTIAEIAGELGLTEEEVVEGLEAEGYTVNKIDEGTIQGVEVVDSDGNTVAKYCWDNRQMPGAEARATTYVFYVDADGNEISRTTYGNGTVVEVVTDTEGRKTTTTVEPVGDGSPTEHEVKEGESLTEIAALYGLTLAELAESNPELFETPRDPDLIHPGETVIIEDGSKTTVTIEQDGYTLTTNPDGSVTFTDAEGNVSKIDAGSVEEALAHVLLSMDPQDGKSENDIVATVVWGLLAGQSYEALAEEAEALSAEAEAVLAEYGSGEVATPIFEEDAEGNRIVIAWGNRPDGEAYSDWVPVKIKGEWRWADPAVNKALAAQQTAYAKLSEVQALYDVGQAQLDVWALDPDFEGALEAAGSTIDAALSPYGVVWARPVPEGTLADAQGRLDDAEAGLEAAKGAVDAYEEAELLIDEAIAYQAEMPDCPRVGEDTIDATGSPSKEKSRAAWAEFDALFASIDEMTVKGDKLSVDFAVVQLETKLENLEEGDPGYDDIASQLEAARELQEGLGTQLELAEAYGEFFRARNEVAKLEVDAEGIKQQYIDQILSQNPNMTVSSDWNHIVNGVSVGEFVSLNVEEKDGQLWAVYEYEYDTVVQQLTFEADGTGRGDADPINLQWQEFMFGSGSSRCPADGLATTKDAMLSSGQALYETLAETFDGTIEDLDTLAKDLQAALDGLRDIGSGSVEVPELAEGSETVELSIAGKLVYVLPETAREYDEKGVDALVDGGPILIQTDGGWQWVDPRTAITTLLEAVQSSRESADNARTSAKSAANWYEFQLTEPRKYVADGGSIDHFADLRNSFFDKHQKQAVHDIYQPRFDKFAEGGYDNAFRPLAEDDIAKALGVDPKTAEGRDAISLIAEEVREIGGDNAKVRAVPIFHVAEAGDEQQTALFAVKDENGTEWYVDAAGGSFANLQDFQDNNSLFDGKGHLVVPKGLDMKPGEDGTVALDVVKSRNFSTLEKVVDPVVSLVTTIATGATLFFPGAALVAAAGGMYLGGRAIYGQVNHLQHGGEWGDATSIMNMLMIGTTVLPVASSGLRGFGKVLAPTTGKSLLASLGAVRSTGVVPTGTFLAKFPQAAYVQRYSQMTGKLDGGINQTAKVFDATAIGMGVPVTAVSIHDFAMYGDQLSGLELADALVGFGTGFTGIGLGANNLRLGNNRTGPGSRTAPATPDISPASPPALPASDGKAFMSLTDSEGRQIKARLLGNPPKGSEDVYIGSDRAPAISEHTHNLVNDPESGEPFILPWIRGGSKDHPDVAGVSAPSAPVQPNSQEFASALAEHVQSKGGVTFAEFMELSLYGIDGKGGYYNGGKVAIGGDTSDHFTTSPEISPSFGRMIAKSLVGMYDAMGRPERFDVVEMGAGNGTLARDIIAKLEADHPDLYGSLHYTIVERSRALVERQRTTLEGEGRVDWVLASADELPLRNIQGVFLSNELVDAFPVHRAVQSPGRGIQEIYITSDKNGQFVEERRKPSPELSEALREPAIQIVLEGQSSRHEEELTINARAMRWMRDVNAALDEGFVMTIDYGQPGSTRIKPYAFNNGKLPVEQSYREAGGIDITAEVDPIVLLRLGEKVGMKPAQSVGAPSIGFEPQDAFLRRHGLAEEIDGAVGPERHAAMRLWPHSQEFFVLTLEKTKPQANSAAAEAPKPPVGAEPMAEAEPIAAISTDPEISIRQPSHADSITGSKTIDAGFAAPQRIKATVHAKALGTPPATAEQVYVPPESGQPAHGFEPEVSGKTHQLVRDPETGEAFILPWIRGASDDLPPLRSMLQGVAVVDPSTRKIVQLDLPPSLDRAPGINDDIHVLHGNEIVTQYRDELRVIQPSEFGVDEISALARERLNALDIHQIEALTRSHVAALSPSQLAQMTPGQFRKFMPEQVAWMSPEQLDALSVVKLTTYKRTHGRTMAPHEMATVKLALSYARMREYPQALEVLLSMINTSHAMYVTMPDWTTGAATAGAYIIRSVAFTTQALFPKATAADTKLGRTLNLSSGISFLTSSPGTWLSFLGGTDRLGDGSFMAGNLIYGQASVRKGVSGGPVDRFLSDHAGNVAYLTGSVSSTLIALSLGSPLGVAAGLLFAFGSVGFWASAIRTDRVNNKPVPRTDAEITHAAKWDASWAMAERISLGGAFGGGMALLAVDKVMSLIAEDEGTGASDSVEQTDESDQEAEIGEGDSHQTTAPGRYNPQLEEEGYPWVDAMDGDSVRTIANAHFADVVETVMLNMDHILRPDLIRPGDRIYLPATA